MSTIARAELRELIHDQLAGRWWWADAEGNMGADPRQLPQLHAGEYTLPSSTRVQRILGWSEVDLLERLPTFKCTQFATCLWADVNYYSRFKWLGWEAPLAFGTCWSTHSLNWVVTWDRIFHFVEPQTDWVMVPQSKTARPGHWGIWNMDG